MFDSAKAVMQHASRFWCIGKRKKRAPDLVYCRPYLCRLHTLRRLHRPRTKNVVKKRNSKPRHPRGEEKNAWPLFLKTKLLLRLNTDWRDYDLVEYFRHDDVQWGATFCTSETKCSQRWTRWSTPARWKINIKTKTKKKKKLFYLAMQCSPFISTIMCASRNIDQARGTHPEKSRYVHEGADYPQSYHYADSGRRCRFSICRFYPFLSIFRRAVNFHPGLLAGKRTMKLPVFTYKYSFTIFHITRWNTLRISRYLMYLTKAQVLFIFRCGVGLLKAVQH